MNVFIVIEGLDLTGKDTQIELLHSYLLKQDIPVCKTRETGGVPGLEFTDDLVKNKGLDPKTQFMVFAMDRSEHVAKVLKPALERGETIICSRYTLSTEVYQGEIGSFGKEFVKQINDFVTDGLEPDLVFIFDISEKEWLRRMNIRQGGTPDDMESKIAKNYTKARNAYIKCASKYSYAYVIDGEQSIEDIHQEVISVYQTVQLNKMRGK